MNQRSISPQCGRQPLICWVSSFFKGTFARFSGLGLLHVRFLGLTPQSLCCRPLAGLGGGAVDSGEALTRNGPATFDHFAGYDEFFNAFLRRKGIHRVK